MGRSFPEEHGGRKRVCRRSWCVSFGSSCGGQSPWEQQLEKGASLGALWERGHPRALRCSCFLHS